MIKVYQCTIDRKLCTSVYVKGKEVRIEFAGGDSVSNGVYVTGNPDIQSAIENNVGFGKKFRLLKSYNNTTEPAKTQPAKQAKSKPVKTQAESEPVKTGSGSEKVFKTVQEAKQFFSQPPYNIVKTKLRTSIEVIEKGKELGFDVIFRKDND
jgi:hypothetical protein